MRNQVAITSGITRSEFRSRYVRKGRPVLLENEARSWPAYDKWTEEYLLARCGANKVGVRTYPDGRGKHERRIRIELRELLQADVDGDGLYLGNIRVDQAIPQIAHDLCVPAIVPERAIEKSTVWIGRSTFSRLHFHVGVEALASLIRGNKTMWLWPPEASRHLKPQPLTSRRSNFSQLHEERERVDPASIPGGTRIELQAGQSLFIPVGWWHTVEGGRELSILNTIFWSSCVWHWPFSYPGLASLFCSFRRRPLDGVLRSAFGYRYL